MRLFKIVVGGIRGSFFNVFEAKGSIIPFQSDTFYWIEIERLDETFVENLRNCLWELTFNLRFTFIEILEKFRIFTITQEAFSIQ